MPDPRGLLAAPAATPTHGSWATAHRADAVVLVRGGSRIGTTGLGCRRAPEAMDPRSAALVRDGDLIRVDIAARRADPLVARCELEARRDSRAPILPRSARGVPNSTAPVRTVGPVAV
ncbi:hypothetical protein [Lysobacter korlensis]|uniref:hypothetical protein n=1 Tax=Lysobacter korlensis TaxID=553636 RepID=UPI00406BC27A